MIKITVCHSHNVLNGGNTHFIGEKLSYDYSDDGVLTIYNWETTTERGNARFAKGEWSFVCYSESLKDTADPTGEEKPRPPYIEITEAEVRSGVDRVKWAEGLILQLPLAHEGRNSWLLNYGTGPVSDFIRARHAERNSD